MKNVCWGLLSTANINRKLISAIRESSRGELIAVASRSQKKGYILEIRIQLYGKTTSKSLSALGANNLTYPSSISSCCSIWVELIPGGP